MSDLDVGRPNADLLCTAVVTTWRRPAPLTSTLASLMRQSYPRLDIVVVCDGEDEEVRSLSNNHVSERPICWIFHPENRGLAAARNTGAASAAGDVVLFLDDDIAADLDLVSSHMFHHQAVVEPRRIVVCGKIDEDPTRTFKTYIDKRLNESRNQIFDSSTAALMQTGQDSIGDDIERGLWCGLNCSLRRNLFVQSGGFNERFRLADEEMELGQRLHLAGFEFIFEPQAQLVHKNAKGWGEYYRNGWRARGALDTYRVLELGQKNAQTQQLAAPWHGYFFARSSSRLAWHLSSPLRAVSRPLEKAANRTELGLLFGAWARTCRGGEYWSEAKQAGCDLVRLKEIAGRSKNALMLHSICTPHAPEESSYYISPEKFHRFMRWFCFADYKTATLSQWHRDEVPARHVLLTFDDGYDDLYTQLFPFLAENRFTAVIFLVASQIGASNVWDQKAGLRARNLLTLDHIREMQRYGMDFGSHTLTHPCLPTVSDQQLQREVTESKQRLEDMLGTEITSFAYPFGGVDRRVRSAVVTAGYQSAFTVLPGTNWWNDPHSQRRAEVNDYTSWIDFASKIRTGLGLGASIGTRLRSLENSLPTPLLRNIAGGLARLGHRTAQSVSREVRERNKSQR